MKRSAFPFAKPYQDRHGRKRLRYRRKKFSSDLGTAYGSDEFKRRYAEAEAAFLGTARLGAGSERTISGSLSIEWIEATGFQPVRFSERMRGLLDFEAARRVKLQNPGDPS